MEHKAGVKVALDAGVARAQEWGITLVRVVVGIVFLVHGSRSLFVIGFYGVADGFERLGIPLPLGFAVLVTLVEFLGGMALILGLFTRPAASALAIEMLVAILLVHLPNGFFSMNHGFEYPLVLFAANAGLLLAGSGRAALDKVLAAHGDSRITCLLLG